MNHITQTLLAAERCGRMAVALGSPDRDQIWRVKAGPGPVGAALAAMTRWADRWGAEVQIEFTPDALDDPVVRIMAEVCAKMGLNGFQGDSFEILQNHFEIESPNRRRTIESIHCSDSVWAFDLDREETKLFVRLADAGDPTLNCEQSRMIDRRAIEDFGLPGICLMENAGCGATLVAKDMLEKSRNAGEPLIVAGGGNNAGDGFVMARGFSRLGYRPIIALLKPAAKLAGDAKINFNLLASENAVEITALDDNPEKLADLLPGKSLIVDALLGTGFTGQVSKPYRKAIDIINASGIQILSLDIPSGLSGDSGLADKSTIQASRTVAFANLKTGHLTANGPEKCGLLYIAEIGAPAKACET